MLLLLGNIFFYLALQVKHYFMALYLKMTSWRKIANKAIDLIAEFKCDDNYVLVTLAELDNVSEAFVVRRKKQGFYARKFKLTPDVNVQNVVHLAVKRGEIRKMLKHDIKTPTSVQMCVNGQIVHLFKAVL